MGRSPCSSDDGLKKGPWSPEEDQTLKDYINKHGHVSWQALPKRAGLNRCGKSCRLRWTNYLRPDIKRGGFSDEEEEVIINLHSVLGNKWSRIATHLPGRTDNEIKNYWNTHLRKKLIKVGIDPKTHKPIDDFDLHSNLSQLQSISNLLNLFNPLEIALSLQANAAQIAKNQFIRNILQAMNTSPLPYIQETSFLLGSQNLAQMDGFINEKISNHPMDPFQEVSSIRSMNNDSARSELEICKNFQHIEQLCNAYPASTKSSNIVDGDFNPEIIKGFSSSTCNSDIEHMLPPLVTGTPGTPGTPNLNPMDSTHDIYIPKDIYESSIFDDLETIVDSDANSSLGEILSADYFAYN